GPAFGVCYIAFRLGLVVWLLRLVLQATRRVPDPLPMLLFAFASYVLLLGQLTGHGTINVYGWLFTGLCIAASREALASIKVPPVARRQFPRFPIPQRRRLR
ncbi:MAG: hypothetical protein K2Q07_08495, partial [Burkholderiaceae bacterium]|nr:hypothetical protein [Burkholderiaceae bacterium]